MKVLDYMFQLCFMEFGFFILILFNSYISSVKLLYLDLYLNMNLGKLETQSGNQIRLRSIYARRYPKLTVASAGSLGFSVGTESELGQFSSQPWWEKFRFYSGQQSKAETHDWTRYYENKE